MTFTEEKSVFVCACDLNNSARKSAILKTLSTKFVSPDSKTDLHGESPSPICHLWGGPSNVLIRWNVLWNGTRFLAVVDIL